MPKITFILEPDAGLVTVESSSAAAAENNELRRLLGQGSALNCARPPQSNEIKIDSGAQNAFDADQPSIRLYRLYHRSTVDGPGRRSVVQVAGCSLRCAGCYVPETHDPNGGASVSIDWIVEQINEQRADHDGVTILGGEPFDQPTSLNRLVERLKAENYHVAIYTGYTLERLLAQNDRNVNQILTHADLLIDGAFERELARGAGEYRGSSNQQIIFKPFAEKPQA